MVVADLKLGSIILPRSETPQAVSRLAEFEWFHKIETENDIVTPEIDDLLLRAQKIYQSVDDVVKGLQIPLQVGIMEILFKGTVIKKKQYEIEELETMISDLETKSPGVINNAAQLLDEASTIQRAIEEYSTIKETLDVVKKLNVDLGGFGLMRYFYTNLFVINSSEFAEVSRSLEGVTIYKYDLESKDKTALIIISSADDSDRVLKVFRGFNANPFVIPAGLPQIPSQAYSLIESKLAELTQKQKKTDEQIAGLKKSLRRDILSLHESAYMAKEVLETLRKPGGTKRFAVIQGYIPKNMESKFREVTKQWMSVVEDLTDPKLIQNRPTLFENKRWVRTFEVITQSQGIPRRGEADPTPMISLMWPIFYGVMFADLGHGLLLMGLGLLFKVKGQGTMSKWGMLIAISGASAAVAGVGAGEMFGFHIDHLQPFEDILHGPLEPVSWLVGVISVAELTFEQVITILKVSIFLGIIHLVWAFILRIKRLRKEGHKQMMILEAIPNLTLYGGIVVIMMCAIGSSYDVMNMYSRVHNEPVPWVTVFLGDWATVWIVTRIAVVIVLGSMAVMMVGGILHAKHHPEDGGSAANVVMEVLLGKTVECLAHTISYARLGIMLLVHAALLMTVNNSFASLGGWSSPGGIAMIVGGNLGIMMIEGLIVYIQSLRLHLYEFFTKWYDGGAQPFRQVVPEMLYNQLIWKKK
ncbi:MAG: V-type ATPase 116kDa subunit family protein [Candidatus Nitrosotenuis sp.]|uniref:A-type ATP synthase subunit I n=1 Tax=Candidatus Nitrosotenuis uzonensis TaxID=1407055 RepID=A0A812F5J1_9ARCH|nr:V-type ATPase 116kDa subunit family protein [Candidatus Nitrosotenuis uzonensis]MCA2003248.1 ATPase [Candidatus Nitrosotenuis sp.]CAE6490041.1 V-type ATP synthase subunit I [Candidatus Nitrosotenuis uzonensis]